MRIVFTNRFNRRYAKLSRSKQEAVDATIARFIINPFDPVLQNHALHGKLKTFRAITSGYDLRLIYREEGGHAIVFFVNVGSHDDVH